MTVHKQVTEFGKQDFLLVSAPQGTVLAAVVRTLYDMEAETEWAIPRTERPGPVMRALTWVPGLSAVAGPGRGGPVLEERGGRSSYFLHRGPAARPGLPITSGVTPAPRQDDRPPGMAEDYDEVRVSTPVGRPDWTLVEFREIAANVSILGNALSSQVRGTDVLYFRRSGPRATEPQHDFHVYRDGRPVRRVVCHAVRPKGHADLRWIESFAEGEHSAYERATLYDGAGEADLLDNRKIETILNGLGFSAPILFGAGATRQHVLINRVPGGTPLHKVETQ